MRRRHSRLGEQNERGFWPKRARSVGERIRNPDGTRSTHLPGPAALWVLHTAAPPPKDVCMNKHVTLWNHSQAQGDHMPCFAEQPCFYFCYFSIPSGFILKRILLGIINYMVTLLKPHCMQPQCLDCVAFLLPPEHCFSLFGRRGLRARVIHTGPTPSSISGSPNCV